MNKDIKKRLLMCVPFVPYPPKSGGKIRVYQALRYMSRHYRIHLIAVQDHLQHSDDIGPLEEFCEQICILPAPRFLPFKLHHLRDFFSRFPGSLVIHSPVLAKNAMAWAYEETFDILQMEFSPLAHYGLKLPARHKALTLHYLAEEAYTGYAEQLNRGFKRWYFQREKRKISSYELDLVKQYDHVFVTSPSHSAFIQKSIASSQISIIPNGVDTEYFHRSKRENTTPVFLFIGSLHINPANQEALLITLSNLFPKIKRLLPDAQLYVIGAGLTEPIQRNFCAQDVHFPGEVEDVRPYFAMATAVLLPMASGSGTKLRIPTAMAMGRVIITTEKGLAGYDLMDGKHLLVANDTEIMAKYAVRLYQDSLWRDIIEKEARQFAVDNFDWKHIFDKQKLIYDNLMRTKHESGS
jgi:glycosyltransferase involved in cell wall biosynthesis